MPKINKKNIEVTTDPLFNQKNQKGLSQFYNAKNITINNVTSQKDRINRVKKARL